MKVLNLWLRNGLSVRICPSKRFLFCEGLAAGDLRTEQFELSAAGQGSDFLSLNFYLIQVLQVLDALLFDVTLLGLSEALDRLLVASLDIAFLDLGFSELGSGA